MMPTNKDEKLYVKEQDLMLDGFRLGKQIFTQKYKPDFIVGIWRGGSSVGIVVQECLQYLGIHADHIPIRTSYEGMQHYPEMIRNSDQIRVHGIDYLVDQLDAEHNLLLVDDVYSSGLSVQAVKEKLRKKLRHNCPHSIKVAAAWYRPVENRPAPDFFVNQTDQWLVLPYELSGLSMDEITANKPWVAKLLESNGN